MISDVISLQNIKDICKDILENHPDISCYLFGSYAKGSPNRVSDIDLLLLFDKEIHNHTIICQIKDALQDSFSAIEKYCSPIYGYKKNINSDSSILFRQYIHYGILLSGQNILPLIKNETLRKLKSLEYTHYWTPMYLSKIEILEQVLKSSIDVGSSSLAWQYLFLIAYWYAKAQLTLVDKQNSLNNFSLLYIYEDLLEMVPSSQQKKVLNIVQKKRENYRNCEYFEAIDISIVECFESIKSLQKSASKKQISTILSKIEINL